MILIGFLIGQQYTIFVWVAVFVMILLASWLISKFSLQYYFLLLLALLLPFSIETSITENLNINLPTEPMLAIAFTSICWDVLRKPGLIKQLFGKESLWILLLLFSFLLTAFFSTILWVSIKFSILNIIYVLVFFIWQKYYFKVYPRLFPKLLGLYTLSLLAVVVYALFLFSQYDWYLPTIKGIFRPFYKDHTILGATTAMLASFFLTYAFIVKHLMSKLMVGSAGLILIAIVIFSNSRAAILSLIFSAFIWILLMLRIRIKYIVISLVSVLLLLGIFSNRVLQVLKTNQYLSHNTNSGMVESLESSGNISSDISNLERLNRWISGVGMFIDRPLTGFGPGTYQFVYIPYQRKEFMNRLTVSDPWHIPENSGGTAHSEYILVLSEMGVLGITVLLILLGRWVWIAFKARNHSYQTTIMIAFISISTYLFHAFFNNFLSTDKFAFLFWGMAAWMMAQFELKSNEEHSVLQ
jgi:O-antigen ligase